MTPELEDYIKGITAPEPEILSALLRESYVETISGRMNSGHLQGRLLKMLTQLSGARRVLELGTFCGYSALCLAEGVGKGGKVVTVEIDDEREDFIRKYFALSGMDDRLELIIGDCLEVMSGMPDGDFDLIFMDADKRRYADYLPACGRLLRPGGILLADNTLWDGHVTDPRYQRDPQTRGIIAFNRMLADSADWEQVVVPVRDGLTIARKL